MSVAMRLMCAVDIVGWAFCASLSAGSLAFATDYQPLTPTMSERMITLTGRDLTIDELVDIARFGAKVQLSAEARQRQADNHGLLLEAAAEGIAVYWFNRGVGDQRETVMFDGDPTSPANQPKIEKIQTQNFHRGALAGFGPEVEDEEIVRAMM